ncbi:MAG TPA: MFS transporter [Chthoniobacterales bacterium]
MSASPAVFTPPSYARHARIAVAAIFFINGSLMGSWAPMIPIVQQRLHLANGQLGLCLLATAIGAILAMPAAGAFISRAGSAPILRVSALALCGAIFLPVLSPNPFLLFVFLLSLGATNGAMDVAMNTHGIAVEKELGRPVMSSYHAMYSFGGFAGAIGGGALLATVPYAFVEPVTIGLACAAASTVAAKFLLPPSTDQGEPGQTHFALPTGRALAFGSLCFLVMLAEGSMLDWTAVYLRNRLGTGASVAALGYSAFSVGMAGGRFGGDRLRQKFGAATLVSCSAALAAAGLFVAVAGRQATVAILGFGVCGLGLSNAVPVLFSAAGKLPGQSTGTGLAAVATLGYAGFLIGPPLIGFASEWVSLGFGLGLVAVICAVVAVLARRVVGVSDHAPDGPVKGRVPASR